MTPRPPRPTLFPYTTLFRSLANVEKDYDLVLIDCAPSLNALTRTAWAASDRVTVITEPGLFSVAAADRALRAIDRKSTRLNSSHVRISYAVFCLKKKNIYSK